MSDERTKSSEWLTRALELGASGSFSVVAGLISAGIAFAVAIPGFLEGSGTARRSISEDQYERLMIQFSKVEADTYSMKGNVDKLSKQISSISEIPKEGVVNAAIEKLSASVVDLNERESKIERVILDSPGKALEVPMLRKDIDSMKEAQQAASATVKDSVDRIYDLNKWLLGAMAVSIVTLATGNLLKGRGTDGAKTAA